MPKQTQTKKKTESNTKPTAQTPATQDPQRVIRICSLCNEPVIIQAVGDEPIDEFVTYKNRKVHKRCFDAVMRTLTKEEQEETKQKEQAKKQSKRKTVPKTLPIETVKEALSEEEYQLKKAYYDYLKEQLGVEGALPAKFYAATDKLIKNYDFDYSGMRQTLIYLVEIQNKAFNFDSNIVNLIPYFYDEALSFYAVNEDRIDQDISKMYQTRTVKITKKKPKRGEIWEF